MIKFLFLLDTKRAQECSSFLFNIVNKDSC